MKTIILGAGAAALLATGALAQSTTHTTTERSAATGSSHNPMIKDSDPAVARTAADGANSFTEEQARGRLTEAGYTDIANLAKDRKGVWRGTAAKGGRKGPVGLDYKGNVVTR